MQTVIVALRVVLALAVVFGLIRYAGRKLSGGVGTRPSRSLPLAIIGRLSLGKGAGIALVEVGGRVLLLGVGEQGVRVLTEIDAPAVEPAVIAAADIPGLVPDGPPVELREELDLASLGTLHPGALAGLIDPVDPEGSEPKPGRRPDGSERLARLAGLAGLAASASAREAGALHGSILSPGTWRRAVNVVQQRTVRR